MSRIIEAKFYCKGTSRTASRGLLLNSDGKDSSKDVWTDTFIEGNWYDGEYKLWFDEPENSERNKERFRSNGRWRTYKVTNEQGERKEIHSSYMKLIFDLDKTNIRDYKIEQILKK